nr:atherin-like [Aegilops tauschii subsp. strangulata]
MVAPRPRPCHALPCTRVPAVPAWPAARSHPSASPCSRSAPGVARARSDCPPPRRPPLALPRTAAGHRIPTPLPRAVPLRLAAPATALLLPPRPLPPPLLPRQPLPPLAPALAPRPALATAVVPLPPPLAWPPAPACAQRPRACARSGCARTPCTWRPTPAAPAPVVSSASTR